MKLILILLFLYESSIVYGYNPVKTSQTNPFHGHRQNEQNFNPGPRRSDVNICEVWKVDHALTENCNDPQFDTSLFGSCWANTWDSETSSRINKGILATCSCSNRMHGEVQLKCGKNKSWFLADEKQMSLCGKYNDRCNQGICPSLLNDANFRCDIDNVGQQGDIRQCSCKHSCRSINLKCVTNQNNNQGYWEPDISCDEVYTFRDDSKHLEVLGRDGIFEYKCLPGYEMNKHSNNKIKCEDMRNGFESPECLPSQNNKDIFAKDIGNNVLFTFPTTSLPNPGPNNGKSPWASPESGNEVTDINRNGGSPNINQGPIWNKNNGNKNQGGQTLPSTGSSKIYRNDNNCKTTQGILIGVIVFLIIIIGALCLVIFLKLRPKKDIDIDNEIPAANTKQEYMETNENYVPADVLKSSSAGTKK